MVVESREVFEFGHSNVYSKGVRKKLELWSLIKLKCCALWARRKQNKTEE